MAYTAWSVVFGEQPTAAKWNQLGQNDAGFKDGTNIDNLAILNRHIAADNLYSSKIYNPYKFSVYRAAAHNSAGSYTKVDHDTTLYDTGGNISGSDKFTAPVAGFYYFNAQAGNTVAGSTAIFSALYKNGAQARVGQGANTAAAGSWSNVHGVLQLAANDYVEHYFIGGGGSVMEVGQTKCFFEGFLLAKS